MESELELIRILFMTAHWKTMEEDASPTINSYHNSDADVPQSMTTQWCVCVCVGFCVCACLLCAFLTFFFSLPFFLSFFFNLETIA